MSTGSAHTALVNAAFLRLGQMEGVLAWKNATGVARAFDDPDRKIRYGLVGSSDLFCVVAPAGRLVCLEAKTGRGRQSTEQIAFMNAVRLQGGTYEVFRSVDDAVAVVTRVRGQP